LPKAILGFSYGKSVVYDPGLDHYINKEISILESKMS